VSGGLVERSLAWETGLGWAGGERGLVGSARAGCPGGGPERLKKIGGSDSYQRGVMGDEVALLTRRG